MYRKVYVSEVYKWLDKFSNRSSKIPNISHPEELALLLDQLRVTDCFPDLQQGHFWGVYAQSHPGEMENSFDVLLHMFATGSEPSSDCQGLRVALREESGIYWLSPNQVNHHGQVWFRNVSPGCYHVVPDLFQLQASTHGVTARRAAAASQPEEDLLVFYPEDRRIRVDLTRRSKMGTTELTVSTQAEELANNKVQFVIGDISGALVLKPTSIRGYFRGTCELELTFRDASRYVPQFLIATSEEEND